MKRSWTVSNLCIVICSEYCVIVQTWNAVLDEKAVSSRQQCAIAELFVLLAGQM